jgi:hypothetical protein
MGKPRGGELDSVGRCVVIAPLRRRLRLEDALRRKPGRGSVMMLRM